MLAEDVSQVFLAPREIVLNPLSMLIGARGFEPPTPCSQGRCASQTAPRPENQYHEQGTGYLT